MLFPSVASIHIRLVYMYRLRLLFTLFIWFIAADAIPSFSFVGDFDPDVFAIRGSATVPGGYIQLTNNNDQVAAAFYNVSQNNLVSNGFVTEFLYSSSSCDDYNYNEPSGFAFVISALHPQTQPAQTGAGSLGATTYRNVIVIGFSVVLNTGGYLSICGSNSTGDLGGGDLYVAGGCQTQIWPVVKDIRCNGLPTHRIEFIPPSTWKISISGETRLVNLDPTPYLGNDAQLYLGFTSSTNIGYMFQSIGTWSLDINPEPVNEGVIPILECYEEIEGNYVAYFGYNNTYNKSVTVLPENNVLSGAVDVVLPLVFQPNRLAFAFSSYWNGSDVTWHLTNYRLSFDTADQSHLCAPSITIVIIFTAPVELSVEDTLQIRDHIASLSRVSANRLRIGNMTYSIMQTKKRQGGDDIVANLELEISQANSTQSGEPTPAEVVSDLVQISNENSDPDVIVNPNGDEGREIIGVKPVPTGTEQVGQLVEDAAPGSSPQSISQPSTNQPSITSTSSRLIVHILHVMAVLVVASAL